MNKRWTWNDTINKKLHSQISLAIELKLHIPDFIILESSEDTEKALLNPNVRVKEDVALEKPLGIPVGFAAFFDGEKFLNYVGMISDGFMFSGSQGFELNSNINMIFPVSPKVCKKYFKLLAKKIIDKDPDFRGFVNINVIIDHNDKWWYDSILFGADPDFIMNYINLAGGEGAVSYENPINFPNAYAASVRIFPLAYPNHQQLDGYDVSFATEIWDVNYIKNEDIFISTASGSNMKDLWKTVLQKCAGLERFNYLYRIDGYNACKHRFHELKGIKIV